MAGLTLALTVIPMGIGYAALAGLPLQVSRIMKFKRCVKHKLVNNFEILILFLI